MHLRQALKATLTGLPLLAGLAVAAQTSDAPALHEFEQAIGLTPNLDRGRELYVNCVACHGPEGWGTRDGHYPQIAGQLYPVIIKQLADIRARNRDNPIMRAFTSRRILGGPQDIADVAGYVANLPMTPDNGRGPQFMLDDGAAIYRDNCADCHGADGQGDVEDHVPSLQAQHYGYLLRQFDRIRSGLRRNADKKMTKQVRGFHRREEQTVLSHTAALRPPPEKLAPPGWINPDFPNHHGHRRLAPVR